MFIPNQTAAIGAKEARQIVSDTIRSHLNKTIIWRRYKDGTRRVISRWTDERSNRMNWTATELSTRDEARTRQENGLGDGHELHTKEHTEWTSTRDKE